MPHGYFSFEVPHHREVGGYHAVEFGGQRASVVEALRRTAARLGVNIVALSDMSVEQVARERNLSLLQSRLAKLREYDEPFHVTGPTDAARDHLFRALHAMGFGCTRHGKYDHAGLPIDPGASVRLLTTLYQRAHGQVLTMGLGDPGDDRELLRRVQVPLTAINDASATTHGIDRWIERIAEISREARPRVHRASSRYHNAR